MVELSIIVAMTENRTIGRNGNLPWNIPDDLKLFKRQTMGNTVIMGRKTFESLPENCRPLRGRNNIVLTSKNIVLPNTDICSNFDDALIMAGCYDKPAFVIGGASVYEQALPRVNNLIISHVNGKYRGDCKFPEINWKEWRQESHQHFDKFTVKEYVRRS